MEKLEPGEAALTKAREVLRGLVRCDICNGAGEVTRMPQSHVDDDVTTECCGACDGVGFEDAAPIAALLDSHAAEAVRAAYEAGQRDMQHRAVYVCERGADGLRQGLDDVEAKLIELVRDAARIVADSVLALPIRSVPGGGGQGPESDSVPAVPHDQVGGERSGELTDRQVSRVFSWLANDMGEPKVADMFIREFATPYIATGKEDNDAVGR